MSQSRKYRGYRTQSLVAGFLNAHGWPYAESAGAGRPGSDVTGTPGLDWEIKARTDLNPVGWLKQAEKRSPDDLPIVVHRPNGVGETPGRYIAYMRLEDLLPLLHAAGYGTPPERGEL